MYQQFGAVVDGNSVEWRLFIPDAHRDPSQYVRGGLPRIRRIQVTGSFQPEIGQTAWDTDRAPDLEKTGHPNGWLYRFGIPELGDGFYEYKYWVTFENGTTRWCGDPCSKYDGREQENSGFVIGGNDMIPAPIARRLPIGDLVIYEMMLDDFTHQFRGSRAALDAVHDKLDYLQELGVNAIEFMPWTAWPREDFSWGYNPYAFFSVEHRYYADPREPLDKLVRLKRLINELHRRNIHVIMDGVFNHVDAGPDPNKGFGYFWLWEDPSDSPFVGAFEDKAFFNDFDFANECTNQFIGDVCRYWIQEYAIDGIRFDYVLGFYRHAQQPVGITRVIADIDAYAREQGLDNLSLSLEFLTGNRYAAIGRTNEIGASGCWYDPLMWDSFEACRLGNARARYIRALNSGKDFDAARRPITYVENHDHSPLVQQAGGREQWWRSQPAAIALMTCCGAAMIHNGQEFGEEYWFPEEGSGRVQSRPLRWERAEGRVGAGLLPLYRKLIEIRRAHPALRSQNFYPDPYDERDTGFNSSGYGVDESKDVVIYHRWDETERFIVVLNFSSFEQEADIPFSTNGVWEDLLNGGAAQVSGFRLRGELLSSHWGRIYRQAIE